MKNLAIALLSLVVASACGSNSAQLPTTPTTPSAATVTVSSIPIAVGEEVTGTFAVHGAQSVYTLTATADGTLVAQLNWAPALGPLELDLADKQFANYPDGKAPIIGRLPVAAGQKYRITVADGAPWDYSVWSAPYVLTTAIE
jgi:hypothetical protein